MITISVKTNVDQLERSLNAFVRDQVQFATARRVRRNSGISFRLIEDASFEILSEMLHPTGFEADGVFPRNLC
jgi:hypothetical protein